MSNDFADDQLPKSSLPRLRFSLLAALLFITLICVALGYAYRTRYCYATALFRVSSRQRLLWDSEGRSFDPIEYELTKKTQIQLIKSNFLLTSAVRNPAIASLPIFAGKVDPVTWLQENIEVDFPGDGEVMEIRLRANRIFDNDVQRVVDAVATAYRNEVLDAAKFRQLKLRDSIAKTLRTIERELVEKMKILYSLEKDLGPKPTKSVDLDMRRIEIKSLTEVVGHMRRRLEIIDINAQLPEEMQRIQKIQRAVITYE
jgi:hypothetical protein